MFKISESTTREYRAASQKSGSGSFSTSLRMIGPLINILALTIWDFFIGLFQFSTSSFAKKESLENQLALVTGGANGLGKFLCMRLAEEKCDLAIVDIDIENAKNTAIEIESTFKVKCRAYQCDVSDYSAIEKLKINVEREMRTVDILVNNAGLLYTANFISSEVKDIQKTIDVNLTSQLLLVRTFLPSMIEKKRGKILSICSMTAKNTLPFSVTYSATKFGVNGFMNALFDELCVLELENQIKLTTIFPDFIRTRKELSDLIEDVKMSYDMFTPEMVAHESIKAVIYGKREKVISDIRLGHWLAQNAPYHARKYAKGSIADMKSLIGK